MTETIVVLDEFVPAVSGDDLSTHTSDSGSGWGSESSGGAGFLSLTLINASGGYIQTTGTTPRVAGTTVTFSSNGDVFGEYVLEHTGASPNAWFVGMYLYNGTNRIGAGVRYLGGNTDMWAYLNTPGATTGINNLPGNPSALIGSSHTVRWELASGTYTLWLDGTQVYTSALAGVDVTGYRAAVRVQSGVTGDTRMYSMKTGKLAPPVVPPFWTNFVNSQETI